MKNLFALIIVFSAYFSNAQTLKPVSYKDGKQTLNGMVTSNTGKKLPGVLILPAWKGIDNEAKQGIMTKSWGLGINLC